MEPLNNQEEEGNCGKCICVNRKKVFVQMLKVYLSILHNIFAAGPWSPIQARDPITEQGEEGHDCNSRGLTL